MGLNGNAHAGAITDEWSEIKTQWLWFRLFLRTESRRSAINRIPTKTRTSIVFLANFAAALVLLRPILSAKHVVELWALLRTVRHHHFSDLISHDKAYPFTTVPLTVAVGSFGRLCAWLNRKMQNKWVREPVEASVLEPAI